ncbi:MAG: outer membrane protein assembly factor BamB [Woeseia sp.]
MSLRAAALAAVVALLSGCGIFGGDKDERLQPQELRDFTRTLPVERVWSAKVGGGSEFLRLALSPAGDGERVYAASHDGTVTAFAPESGKRLWRNELKVPLSAGPGSGRDRVVVASSNGYLICLRADDGSEVWRVSLAGESLARPLIRDDYVVAYTIDGTLRVLSLFNGEERWSLEQGLPPLTLRGAAPPIVVGNTLIAGFDNGRLIASGLSDGATRWEVVLSPPTGRSDLERLSDIDGMIAAVGQDVYATAYQGRLAALAAESGQVLWTREISTHVGVAADLDNVYVVTETGELVALTRQSGAERWRHDALLRREPTPPVVWLNTVVVGDLEGYVHFFDSADGNTVARMRVGKGMLSGAPVVIEGRLYVQSESGQLSVFDVPTRDDGEQARIDAAGEIRLSVGS